MCTNFEAAIDPDAVYEVLSSRGIKPANSLVQAVTKNNIRPTNQVLTLLKQNDECQLTNTNWGIKFKKDSPLIFNSRIETIKGKTFWKNAFNLNRAVNTHDRFL